MDSNHAFKVIVGTVAGMLLIVTFILIVLNYQNILPNYTILILHASWAIVPPIWFWLEYFFIYTSQKELELEAFKYGQQLSMAIWLGIVTFLTVLISSDIFKNR